MALDIDRFALFSLLLSSFSFPLGACGGQGGDHGGGEIAQQPASATALAGVVWSVAEPGACGSISQGGVYSAPSAPAACHVVATSAVDPSRSASATVTVSPAALAISPSPATVLPGGTQQFTVTPSMSVNWSVNESAAPTPPAYPVKLSSSGHYLVDRNGAPWRVQADAAWVMSCVATPEQVDTYLAARKAQGFNAFYLMAMVHPGGYGTADAAGAPNHAGAPPFTGAMWTTPNETYWAWIDTIIDKAAAQGMVVMLAFEYLGYPSSQQGWWSEVGSRSLAASQAWGTFLGNRYRSKPNLIWFGLGDQTPDGSVGTNHLAAINAIKAAGATQLWMAEAMGGNADPILDAPAFASVLDMHSYYGYGATGRGDLAAQAERCYRATPARPAWVQEGGYEYENNTGSFAGQPYETRRTRFWNALAGGTAGDGFGSRDVYQWANLPSSLSTPGALYSQHAFTLFASLPWWNLRPSGTWADAAGKVLVTSGGGTRGGGSMDEITSALTSDGRTLLAYVPTTGGTSARTFSVDMSALAAPVRARWWDPTTGAFTLVGSGYANGGMRSFTTPGKNGGGQNDWVLLLDVPGSRCGSISSNGLYTAPATPPSGVTCRVEATSSSNPSLTADAPVTFR